MELLTTPTYGTTDYLIRSVIEWSRASPAQMDGPMHSDGGGYPLKGEPSCGPSSFDRGWEGGVGGRDLCFSTFLLLVYKFAPYKHFLGLPPGCFKDVLRMP